MRKISLLAAIATTLAPAIAPAHPQDSALNKVYAELRDARAAADVPGMAGAFEPGALLIDPRSPQPLAGAELEARLKPMAARLVADQVKVETAYRIERRSVMGDVAVDAGLMHMRFTRPEGAAPLQAGQPRPRQDQYARFLVTMRRQPDGRWRIIGDASLPATAETWAAAQRQEGLHFDG
jgi:ketosteroid isomerase-like protein